jgi:hypothetical protein
MKKIFIIVILLLALVGCSAINTGDEMIVAKVERVSTKGRVKYTLLSNNFLSPDLIIYSEPLGWNVGDVIKLTKMENWLPKN